MRRRRLALVTALLAVTVLPASAAGSAPDESLPAAPAPASADRRAADLEPADITTADRLDRTPKPNLGSGTEPRTYLIRLTDPAVPTYEGGKAGLQRTAPRGADRLDPESPPARAYRDHLVEVQTEFIDRMERTTSRPVDVPFIYQYAVNGVAAVLTPAEAHEVAKDPAVASIALDQERVLHTDAGPSWEGANALWNANPELGLPGDIFGEGVIIGTIDTGISPSNRSFAETGDDGYTHINPLGAGNYLGVCDPSNTEQFDPNFVCNEKLIGAYGFLTPSIPGALDYDGHGSHTASTSGGNVLDEVIVSAPTITTTPFAISGVAPHANIIAYLGCCSLSGLTAAIDQAIADEVDVINYSIGSSAPSELWDVFDAVGFLNARAAGIFVATSNGNDGPGVATTGSPAGAAWLTSVGASTHNRHNGNILTDLISSGGPLAAIPGKSVTGMLGLSPIVDAAAFGDPACLDESGHEPVFLGKIVVCERGINGRVEKSENVAAQGAVGYVLTNDEVHGDSLLGDEYALPGVFISFDHGVALRAWLAAGTGHMAAIAGTNFVADDQFGDIMASFSSRGPNRAIDTIVPSVTAPGVDILAALGAGNPDDYGVDVHGFISGTSMSSPHVAGAGALLRQARPDWTPAQAQSALMTTARTTVLNHDGDPATPYARGSGHVDVGDATLAGLLFDETFDDYMAANPAEGGDPKTLNLPSFANTQCLVLCEWERVATVPVNADAPVPDDVTWTPSTTTDTGLSLTVTLSVGTVSPGDSVMISVSADVSEAPEGVTLFGRISLTPSDDAVPTVTMPVAVVPSAGVLPDAIDVSTRRDARSYVVSAIESVAVSDFTGSVSGLVPATLHAGSLAADPTNDDPYDDLAQVDVRVVNVPAGTTRFVAESIEFEMPDLDMFVGTGTIPSLATEVCASASAGAKELCEIPDPEAGDWWVLIQNWEGSDAQPDNYVLATAAVPSADLGNAGVEGPPGAVPLGEPYDVRVHWDEPAMTAGDIWYGTAVLGSSPATPGNVGSFPVTIHRDGDDVAKTASVAEATPGGTISYEITVETNVTPEDLTYTIVDTVPDGLTIDTGSVTGGGVVDGQTITWEFTMPTAVGLIGDYVASTPGTSATCADPWIGFVDLSPTIPFSPLDGDTVAGNAFSSIGPFEQYGQQFANLTVAEDGLITVAGGYGLPPGIPQVLPDAALPNGVFAPLWADLEASLADGRGIRLAESTSLGAAVVQYDDLFEFTSGSTVGPSVGRFQAWIYNTVDDSRPEMTFEYDTLGALPTVATIGVEDISGGQATSLLDAADPTALLEEGGTICLDYLGPAIEPVTVGYGVTVDDDASPGTYTNEAVHITDDPFAEPVTVSDAVEVAVADQPPVAELSADPDTGEAPLDVTFTTAGTGDAEGPLASFSLSFGDGDVLNGAVPPATVDHTYEDPGTYTAILTVTDSAGAAANDAATVDVTEEPVPPGPTAPGSVSLFAEGTVRPGFIEYLTIQNPTPTDTVASFDFQAANDARETVLVPQFTLSVSGNTRTTVDLNQYLAAHAVPTPIDISVKVTSPGEIVAERPMYFSADPALGVVVDGGHVVVGATSPATEWFFAEGTLRPGFVEFITLQNPDVTATTATLNFQVVTEAGIVPVPDATVELPANSRRTVNVRETLFLLQGPLPVDADVSVRVTAGEAIVVERPMYFFADPALGTVVDGGHDVFGTNAASTLLNFAEGTVRPGFVEYITLQNAGTDDAVATLTFQAADDGGAAVPVPDRNVPVPAGARVTLNINEYLAEQGVPVPLNISIQITSDQPITAERPMYFSVPGDSFGFFIDPSLIVEGGHDVVGARTTAQSWSFAEGTVRPGFQEYLTIQNPGTDAVTVTLDYQLAAGASPPPTVSSSFVAGPGSRTTVNVNDFLLGTIGSAIGAGVDVSVHVTASGPIAVERPMYFVADPALGTVVSDGSIVAGFTG